ncbi:MAG TPA: CBS domain-containing protein [Pseudonocardiaceae bacterium]|nr:CBS domain-containing protein [Pseudonocardiaceae bacterium]
MNHRTVGGMMTHEVVSVLPDTPFKQIATLLTDHHISAVPVTDVHHRVLGVVSEADLLRRFQPPARHWWPWRAREPRTTATALMTAPAVTIGVDANVVTAAQLLHKHNVKRLPVVDADGRLVGVVSRHDLVGVFVRPDEDIRDEIRQDVVLRGMFVEPTRVDVAVHDGVVTLRGQLERASLVAVLVALTRRVDGVVDVTNELTYEYDDTRFDDGTGPQNIGIQHGLWGPR